MWFKNLIVYCLEQNFSLEETSLEEALQEDAFTPCGSQQASTLGWVPPMGRLGSRLCHDSSGYLLLTAKKEERLLPASVIRDAVNEKVESIELEHDRRVGRKERLEIKEDLIFEMMPRAFTRSSLMNGLLMPEQGLLVIDAASRPRAEEWIGLLRETLGSLPVKPVSVRNSPISIFTGWLTGAVDVPSSITIGDQCELRSPEEEGAIVRCSRQDLSGEEIQGHLDAGKVVMKLAMEWNESLSFVLTEGLEVKRLRFGDTLREQAAQDGAADAAAEFDANFMLMSLEFSRFLPALWEIFGDIEHPE